MKKILLISLIIIFSVMPVLAVNLDEPAKKEVTIKSEIERGKDAIQNISDVYKITRTTYFLDSVDSLIKKNGQSNTDTDAFLLGVYFSEWKELKYRIDFLSRNNLLMPSQEKYYNAAKNYALHRANAYQKKLEISNDELFNIFLISDEFKQIYINQ